jgi:D-xylose transport system permease protein
VIGIQDKQINDVSNYVLSKNVGLIVAVVFTLALAGASVGGYLSRRRAGLPTGNAILIALRVAFYGGLAFAAVIVANHSRGFPLVGLIVLFVVVLWSYVAGRTTFGRHVYAVGGNAEAARRSGINVRLIRILVFTISGAMAGLGGVILASRLNSIDLTAGGGTLLLDAISAAVIGGVSLFGGRGRVVGALFGGLIIGMISNGIDLVGYTDAVKYITTGVILLAAVTLDTVARRRQAATGR